MKKILYYMTIVIVLLSAVLMTCSKSEQMTIEMERYYTVYENIIEKSPKTMKLLIRAASNKEMKLEYGNLVVVLLKEKQLKLSIDTIMNEVPMDINANQYYLNGEVIGIDEKTNESLIGFKYEVSNSDWFSTKYNEKETKIIIAAFKAEDGKLIFQGIDSIKTLERKPVMIK